jgi:uncharacterized damage-inducible protein DinB
MTLSEALLPEFDEEMKNTRRVLERVPEDKFSFKPHPKSGTMIWLAGHLANIPEWASMAINTDSIDFNPPGGPPYTPPPQPKSVAELLSGFDKNVAEARVALAGASDEHLHKNWTMLNGGETVLSTPRVTCLRSWVLNHSIHHRAQLGVYLRLNDIAVPAIYGNSADEKVF